MTANDTISVRRATDADLEVLAANEPRPELALASKNLQLQADGRAIYAVAEKGGQVCGTGLLDLREDHELYPEIKGLWVYPAFRRMGVGSAVSRWLEGQARSAGLTEVFWAVDPNNVKAIPMSVEMGYSPTGEHLFVENPDRTQVEDPSQVSDYHAIYRKSLTARD